MDKDEKLLELLIAKKNQKTLIEGLEKKTDGHELSLYGVKGDNGLVGDVIRIKIQVKWLIRPLTFLLTVSGAGALIKKLYDSLSN